MNIYQKLIEVRKAVPYLKKDNTGFQFKYVSSSQTLGSLRDAMDEQGLLLVPRVLATEIRDHTTRKGDHEYFSIFNMTFTWINAEKPDESIECPWTGHGLDDGEKGVGKALTYAEKYFLLKFFNIATDKDDPDSFQKDEKGKGSSPQKKEEPPKGEPPATPPAEPPKSKDSSGLDQKQKQLAIKNMLLEIYINEEDAEDALFKMTTWERDGTVHEGKRNAFQLKTEKAEGKKQTQTDVYYHETKKLYDGWKAAQEKEAQGADHESA